MNPSRIPSRPELRYSSYLRLRFRSYSSPSDPSGAGHYLNFDDGLDSLLQQKRHLETSCLDTYALRLSTGYGSKQRKYRVSEGDTVTPRGDSLKLKTTERNRNVVCKTTECIMYIILTC